MTNLLLLNRGCSLASTFRARQRDKDFHPDTVVEEGIGFVDIRKGYVSIDLALSEEQNRELPYARLHLWTGSEDPDERAAGEAVARLLQRYIEGTYRPER